MYHLFILYDTYHIKDRKPVQSSPQYLRGSGEREVEDWRKGEWRPLARPPARGARIADTAVKNMWQDTLVKLDWVQVAGNIFTHQ